MGPVAVFSWYETQSRFTQAGLAVILLLLVGWVDFVTTTELGVSLFYLAPVLLLAWAAGFGWGLAFAGLAGLTGFLADYPYLPRYSHWFYPVWEMVLRISFFAIGAFLISRLKTEMARERELARTDPLTGLWNSRYFFELTAREVARVQRNAKPLSIAYFDLDNFKTINDTLGHATGDELLQEVARVLRRGTRTQDICGRLGGDEFALVLPETDTQETLMVVGRLRDEIRGLALDRGWPVTLSLGAVTYAAPPASVEQMVSAADRLMYLAKNNGKNAIRQEVAAKG